MSIQSAPQWAPKVLPKSEDESGWLVAGLKSGTTDEHLRTAFEPHGHIISGAGPVHFIFRLLRLLSTFWCGVSLT